jgi:bifunctional non-homologous end joining protein LigD
MLAVAGQAFDSPAHFFEIKWDGYRAAAMVEGGGVRLMSRGGLDLVERYPSLSDLRALPGGLVLDGELVAFKDGKPDFESIQKMSRSTVTGQKIGQRGGGGPVTLRFVAFDVLYQAFDSRMDLPFADRRRHLEDLLAGPARCPSLVLSEGVAANGRSLYASACAQGLEGVVGKKLSSPYAPGKRNGAWIKAKRRVRIQAVVIGYIEKAGGDFQSLLVASSGLPGEEGGPLRYVGRVGSGFTGETRDKLLQGLAARRRARPLVACPERGAWVEPGLYCTVSYAEMTTAGLLRAPVFEGLIEE